MDDKILAEIQKEASNSLNLLTNDMIIPWLERQFWNQTFDDDVAVDVEEIREVLEMDDCLGGTLQHD